MEDNSLIPFVVSEGASVNIGSQLILEDIDSNNSMVYIDRVYVEVLNGTSAERLYFSNGMFVEDSGSGSLIMQPNYTVRIQFDISVFQFFIQLILGY